MTKKLVFIGIALLALVLTSGTFAYTYTNSTATLQATLADSVWTTYEASLNQPDWNNILPASGTASEVLLPTGEGDYTNVNYQFPDYGSHWEKVSDMYADDSAAYISTQGSSNWQRDLYEMQDFTSPVSDTITINSVTVFVRFATAGNWNSQAMAELKTHDEVFSGEIYETSETLDFAAGEESFAVEGGEESFSNPPPTTTPTYVDVSWQNDTNPSTGEAWTWAEINDLQAGVALKGGKSYKPAYCTLVYIQVDYEYPGDIQGDVPEGELFDINPNAEYTGDLYVKVYLINAAELCKAYQFINMTVYTTNSDEAGQTPNYRVLSLETGVVEFCITGGTATEYTVMVTGGSYRFLSDDPAGWGAGYDITPEFYCEITQR